MNRTGHLFGFKSLWLTWGVVALRLAVGVACRELAAAPALGPTNSVIPYNVRTWQVDDGLPQNSVHAITQTPDGYLWVGTREGLARFDGVRFTLPGETAPRQLSQAWITALCAGRDGSLWIGCEGHGVVHWKDGKFTHLSEADGLISSQIRCLLEGPDGALWIGSEGGVTRYSDGKFTNFTEKNGLLANSVRGLCWDHQGNLLIATLRGLCILDQEGIIRAPEVQLASPANALKFVSGDRQGRTWIGSNEGLACLDGQSVVTYGLREGLPDKIATTAHEDQRGQLWVGTYRGVARMINGKFIHRPHHESAFGDLIYTIFEDREGSLWVGGQDGLYRLTPARFTAYTTQEGLTRNNVMSVCEDSTGTIWIATWGGGLNRLKNDKITVYTASRLLRGALVLSLHEARDGSLWVGLDHGGGLVRLKDKTQDVFAHQPNQFDAAIRVIQEDSAGTLWLGTSRGLNIFKNGKFEGYTAAHGLAGNTVFALCQDAAGVLWIGTDRGLTRRAGGAFSSVNTPGGPSTNAVNAFYLDGDQTLWIGTRTAGLFRYKEGKFAAYSSRQGLFSDEIYHILEDDYGCFWMSCRKGIFRVRKRQLDALDRGGVATISCTAFGRADGLPTIQCNGVAQPGGWKSRDGRLWFPTIRGVVAIEPGIKTNERPPPVLIEEVIADGRLLQLDPFPASKSLNLRISPGRGSIKIHYTALSLQAAEKNRFKYRLDGIDPDWVDAGTRRSASYENIAPGKYRFRVLACNNDGVWNGSEATLLLYFVPHYWQTWWFKLLLGVAAALLLTLLYRLRVGRLRAIERLRIQIAANLHDDVGARLTKVAMLTEAVDRETTDRQSTKPHIRNIFRTVREITRAMDEIVWTINPKNDTLAHLANYVFQYAQEYFQDTGVSCRLALPAQLPDRPVSTEVRHNLFMAVKEALNNALKHAAASEVRIGLAVTDGHMTITITDNGRGFAVTQARARGNGLDNMQQRLAQIGGRLVLESEPGRGTQIRMEVTGMGR